jgi:pimeloyl-ACP methyl ester carboxylesterase
LTPSRPASTSLTYCYHCIPWPSSRTTTTRSRSISLIEASGPWTNPGRLGQYQADLAWLEDSSHLDRLDRIKSPSLAMAFEHDCWFPPRAVREAAERIPGCRYAELPGLGHGAPLLAADQVNPILAEFLD